MSAVETMALLHGDLAMAASAAPALDAALTLALDPFRLDLPPVPGAAAAPEALGALSALYLAARLEETRLPAAAEWLVAERASLRVPPRTAARLETLARRRPAEYAASQRALLYARLFGLGTGVTSDTAGSHARFEPLLGALCSAIVACGTRRAGPTDSRHAAVARAAMDLAQAAGAVYSRGVAAAVAPINEALRNAVDLLSDPGIGALAGTHGLWPTLAKLLEPHAPDLRSLVDAGRYGQRVLRWLAGAIAELQRSEVTGPEIGPEVVAGAAAWLAACGLPARAGGEDQV